MRISKRFSPYFLVSIGLVNVIHALFHIYQFVISILFSSSLIGINTQESWIGSLIIGLFGIISLIIGISDYIHHTKCNDSKLIN